VYTDWPFKIIDKATKPIIQVEYKGETKEPGKGHSRFMSAWTSASPNLRPMRRLASKTVLLRSRPPFGN
jgi:hypothetical protein